MNPIEHLRSAARVLHSPCGDGRLVWHVWGQGRPVLLLHGGSGSWTHWVRNIQPLVDAGRSVWAPDLPGFGDSARPADCDDADAIAPWLDQAVQHQLGDEAVDVLAFSFGALVAGYWAAAEPQRLASLMLVGAPALSDERLPPLPLRFWTGLPPGERRDAAHRHNLRVLMLAHDESVDDLALAVPGPNVERDRLRRRRLPAGRRLGRTRRAVSQPAGRHRPGAGTRPALPGADPGARGRALGAVRGGRRLQCTGAALAGPARGRRIGPRRKGRRIRLACIPPTAPA